jgi:hypothetical protein
MSQITLKTIAQIKSEIGINTLNLSRQLDEANMQTAWLSHWDNEKRIRVTIHEDTLRLAKEEGSKPFFFIKTEQLASKGGANIGKPYVKHMICKASIETTL